MMMRKALLMIVIFALAGCGAAKRVKPVEESPGVRATTVEPVPANSWRSRIVEAAKEEWVYFGQQKVVIDGDEESIPHVGIWEDDDYSHSDRVNQYWRAVGKYRLSGNDCQEPWSAAFISWVMQAAGVPETLFPPAIAHHTYLSYFLDRQSHPAEVFIPHTIQGYSPRAGDLICANRGPGYFGDPVEELPNYLNGKLHCDIVVETDGRTLQVIGGNVRNSVSKTILTLNQDGHLQMSRHRPWFLVIENRLD